MVPIREWPPENVLEKAGVKYGLMLATGKLGWKTTPEVATTVWRRFKYLMAPCDLNVVHEDGARALCRLMYTEHRFVVRTRDDEGLNVNYHETA